MAITTFAPLMYPHLYEGQGAVPSFGQWTLNASGDRAAMIIQVPKSGTLEWFECRIGNVSNNPDNGIRLSFQDVDPATGLPDGTQDQFFDHLTALSSNTWITPSGAMTNTGAGGGVKRTVTAGDFLACVVDFVSFVASDNFVLMFLNVGAQNGNYWNADGTAGGAFSKSASAPLLALKYADGTYAELLPPAAPLLGSGANAVVSLTFHSGSTPDEYALRFQLPIKSRSIGFWARIDVDAAVTVELLDASNNVLESVVLDADMRATTTTLNCLFYWDTPVELDAATTYRLTFRPTTVTTIGMASFICGRIEAMQGGAAIYQSNRTNAGAWTDETSSRLMAGLILDGFEQSVGGGGGGETSHVSFG